MKCYALCILVIGFFSGIAIDNIQEPSGNINATLFDSEENHLKNSFLEISIDIKPDRTVSSCFTNIPDSYYSIVATHDVNENDKINSNFPGISTEPYAFSNNIKPGFWAPACKET